MSAVAAAGRKTRQSFPAVYLIFASCLLPLMLSGDSLWIDEAYTAQMARLPTFADLVHEFHIGKDSHHQMPLGMAYAWVAAHIAGTSELGLRAPNIVWALITFISLAATGNRLGLPWLPLLAAVHPFLWRYVDEARPYAMQIAGGALCCFGVAAVLQSSSAKPRWAQALAAGSVLLAGSSLLGTIPVGCVGMTVGYAIIRDKRPISRECAVYLACAGAVIAIFACFYAWTLLKGAGGTRVWPVNVANVLFAAYELAGFTGLGPGRLQLRDAASQSTIATAEAMLPYAVPIALSFAFYVCLAVNWSRSEVPRQQRRIVFAAAVVCALTIGLMVVLAYAVRWPFWGRHVAAILPFELLIIASWISAAKSLLSRIAAVALCALLVFSALKLRFGLEHRRDDYRAAASVARAVVFDGKTVWWCADAEAAKYYHVQLATAPTRGAAVLVENATGDRLHIISDEAPPDLIVYTRANACDQYHAIADFIRENGWTVVGGAPAFTFYKRMP